MAEESTTPDPESALGQRIRDYFNSPQAKEHFLQGASQADTPFLSLQGFKERESGRKRPSSSQGSVHQGSPFRKEVTYTRGGKTPRECKIYGHDWVLDHDAFSSTCERCGLSKTMTAVQDFLADEDEEQATRTCIWCGKVCASVEDLDLHEADCEP